MKKMLTAMILSGAVLVPAGAVLAQTVDNANPACTQTEPLRIRDRVSQMVNVAERVRAQVRDEAFGDCDQTQTQTQTQTRTETRATDRAGVQQHNGTPQVADQGRRAGSS